MIVPARLYVYNYVQCARAVYNAVFGLPPHLINGSATPALHTLYLIMSAAFAVYISQYLQINGYSRQKAFATTLHLCVLTYNTLPYRDLTISLILIHIINIYCIYIGNIFKSKEKMHLLPHYMHVYTQHLQYLHHTWLYNSTTNVLTQQYSQGKW